MLIRTLKRCLVTAAILACPGIIAGIFGRWLFLFAAVSLIPVIYLLSKLPVITGWELASGVISDVTLYNDHDQPCTEAHISFKAKDGNCHECIVTIGHYGDYEEGIEPELERMLNRDKAFYMKKTIPVFYSPEDTGKCIVYLEDAE